MPRVITGTAKGLELKVPHKARPISDRAKASIFSVIGSDIEGKKILDLYAGSGSLGIEALSRGASHCTFVEASRYAVRDIKDNLDKADLSEQGHATHQKGIPFLNNQSPESFDIVFADPPFNFYKDNVRRTHSLLEKLDRVIPNGGAIVLKHPKGLQLPTIETLTLADQRNFGTNTISLWVKMEKT